MKYILIVLKILQAIAVAVQAGSMVFLFFITLIAVGLGGGILNVSAKEFIVQVVICCFANLLFTAFLFILDLKDNKSVAFGNTKNTAKLAMLATIGTYLISIFCDVVCLLSISEPTGGLSSLRVLNAWTIGLAFYLTPKILTPLVLLCLAIRQIKYSHTPAS